MKSPYRIVNLWESGSETVREQVIRFWIAEKALPSGIDARERAAQILLVASDESGAVAGVCTVYNAVHPRLEHRMFHFRAFVAARARRHRLALEFVLAAQAYLERHNQSLPRDQRALGLIMEVEAAVLKSGPLAGQARWTETQMNFIGRTPSGAHLRVWYFEDAPLNFA